MDRLACDGPVTPAVNGELGLACLLPTGWRPSWDAGEPGEHYLDVADRGTDIRRSDLHRLAKSGGVQAAEIDDMVDA